jgi:hypothetical protein
MGEHRRIGEMLISKGKITREQLNVALNGKNSSRRRTGEWLVALGFVTEQDITDCLAEQYGLNIIDVNDITAEPQALELLSGETALAHRVLPFRYSYDCIECVMADPIDFPTADMISRLAGKRAMLYLAPSSNLVASIQRAYHLLKSPKSLITHTMEYPRPRPQKDRESILARLEAAAHKTDKGRSREASKTLTAQKERDLI